ncbi:MAG: hypothetical protein P4L63_02785 [Candidatus Pacebacteria bacterium]|nr:hypothetical protein [Candidatus Paceibacterota bacterium]
MIGKKYIVKLISSIVIILIITPVVLLSVPKKAKANDYNGDFPEFLDEGFNYADLGENSADLGENTVTSGTTAGVVAPATASTAVDTHISLAMKIEAAAKEVLRQAIIVIEHKLLDSITQSTVNWINSGFSGSPLFVQNPSQFFGDIGQFEIKNIINQTGYNSVQFPFGKAWDLQVINMYKQAGNADMQSSYSQITNDPALVQSYQNNFNAGGWNAFFLNTQYPQNNYPGYSMLASQNLASQLAGTTQNDAQKVTSTLQQGMGFLSPQVCPASVNPSYNNSADEWHKPTFTFDTDGSIWNQTEAADCPTGINATCEAQTQKDYDILYSEAQDTWAETNQCIKPNGTSGLVTTTPGAVVANQITSALNLKTGSAQLDAALGNSISAILNAFINHFLQQGLSALSQTVQSIPSPDSWSYAGQTLNGAGGGGTTNPLVVPTSVLVKPGNTTSTIISGGTAPYTIQTPPGSSVATANISGTNLSVTGVAGGQTSFVVTDSGTPAQTATVQVTTSLIVDFNNPTALQKISAGVGSSTNITISNGTAPYSIQSEPDSTIALGLISDNVLTIIGVAPGNTSIILQDSSTPANTITLQIVIGSESSLSVPAVSANIGSTTNVTISGGTPPFAIITPSNSSIASALVSGNTLTVIGSTAGTTSVTIQDSFSPEQTINVPITVGATKSSIIDFSNPQTQNVSLTASGTTNLTLVNGKVNTSNTSSAALYSIKTEPSSAVAIAQIYGNTLSLTGVASGTTSMIVQDQSNDTDSLNITVTGNGTTPSNPTSNSLTIPQNISESINNSQTITITGGTVPYSISTWPNGTVASVALSGSNITITGNSQGSTPFTVQDSSTPVHQTVTSTITVSSTSSQLGTCSMTINGVPESACSTINGNWTNGACVVVRDNVPQSSCEGTGTIWTAN